MIVFDYLVNEWSEWSQNDGLSACMWNGSYVYLSSTFGPMVQQTSYFGMFAGASYGTEYGMDIELAWLKPNDLLQGSMAVRWISLLGQYVALTMRSVSGYPRRLPMG